MVRVGKVTDAMRREVLAEVAAGISYRQIAPGHDVSEVTIRRIVQAQDAKDETPERIRREGSLGVADREEIAAGIMAGESCPEIAKRIGFDRSTVWREIRRNGGRESYQPHRADRRALEEARRYRPSWVETKPWLWSEVRYLLGRRWSPQQIAQRLRRDYPGDPEWVISHESIYKAIFAVADKKDRTTLTKCLRSRRPRRRKHGRRTNGQLPPIVGVINIAERPEHVLRREEFGHWEGDLVVGRHGRSFVATLVERTTRLGMLLQLGNKTTGLVTERLTDWIDTMPEGHVRTLTWDRGTELAAHIMFSRTTGVPVYFCDPHSPWQRGSNENWNGLLRQFLPRGAPLTDVTQAELDRISHLINTRPRRVLDWETPAERLDAALIG